MGEAQILQNIGEQDSRARNSAVIGNYVLVRIINGDDIIGFYWLQRNESVSGDAVTVKHFNSPSSFQMLLNTNFYNNRVNNQIVIVMRYHLYRKNSSIDVAIMNYSLFPNTDLLANYTSSFKCPL